MENKSSVKNYQSENTIKLLFAKAFNEAANDVVISKLSGGMKNAVYLIKKKNFKTVLKIAAKDETKLITVDRNILWWEVEMLKMMEQLSFPAPKLLYYDDSCLLCESSYFFMSYIEGEPLLNVRKDLSSLEIANIDYELGLLSSKISSISGNRYYIPSMIDKYFENNYQFIVYLFEQLINDARSISLDLKEDIYESIMNILKDNHNSLNNTTGIFLTHTDIWDGNILINNGKVAGIVDFSDLYYCDELLNFYFHNIDGKTSEHFLKGYNKELNNTDKMRIEIYRMYVIIKMIVDCKLKEYGRFEWMYENLNNRMNLIKNESLKKRF